MRRHDSIPASALLLLLLAVGCDQGTAADSPARQNDGRTAAKETPDQDADGATGDHSELVLAGGCFWCMEVAFEQLRGVSDVVSGYAGGSRENANYGSVSAGVTHHAEAIRITYDPEIISEETLLKVFFTAAHDPTQINRQYPDVGRQYRSAVFYTSDEQQRAIKQMIANLDASGKFEKPIATTLEPLEDFYPAEDYHQDYVKHNPHEPYVVAHSLPKAAKVRKAFPELIRAK